MVVRGADNGGSTTPLGALSGSAASPVQTLRREFGGGKQEWVARGGGAPLPPPERYLPHRSRRQAPRCARTELPWSRRHTEDLEL
jgi:hypothetical protein